MLSYSLFVWIVDQAVCVYMTCLETQGNFPILSSHCVARYILWWQIEAFVWMRRPVTRRVEFFEPSKNPVTSMKPTIRCLNIFATFILRFFVWYFWDFCFELFTFPFYYSGLTWLSLCALSNTVWDTLFPFQGIPCSWLVISPLFLLREWSITE